MMEEKKVNSHGDKRGLSPNSRKNLEKRNLKGNSHTKKDYSITRIIKEMLDQEADVIIPGVNTDGKSWRQLIARAMLTSAAKGNPTMIANLQDRLEGKVTQPIAGDGEIVLRVKYDG